MYIYNTPINLQNNEGLAKVNKETGEMQTIKTGINSNRSNPEVVKHNANEKFIKNYTKSWELLASQTRPIEYKVAHMMSQMTKMITNSLEPLNDETTIREIAEKFTISTGKVKLIIDKLFKLGVYGKFECYNEGERHSKYWVFNPYLSSNGPVMNKNSRDLFSNTLFAKIYQ